MKEYITLQQFLKIADFIDSTGYSKIFLAEHEVYVNGEKEERRGRKLYENDLVQVDGQEFRIHAHQ